VTVWFWRNSRHDPELLGPLEIMGKRRFRGLDGGAQQQWLDRERPDGAEPMRWGLTRGAPDPAQAVDLNAVIRSSPKGYDDLRDPVPVEADSASGPEFPAANELATFDDLIRFASSDSPHTSAGPAIIAPSKAAPVADLPIVPVASDPFVIVPMDHELPGQASPLAAAGTSADRSASVQDSERGSADSDDSDDEADPDITKGDQRGSIDPLLRRFHDG
jgi:hypothetical protein